MCATAIFDNDRRTFFFCRPRFFFRNRYRIQNKFKKKEDKAGLVKAKEKEDMYSQYHHHKNTMTTMVKRKKATRQDKRPKAGLHQKNKNSHTHETKGIKK